MQCLYYSTQCPIDACLVGVTPIRIGTCVVDTRQYTGIIASIVHAVAMKGRHVQVPTHQVLLRVNMLFCLHRRARKRGVGHGDNYSSSTFSPSHTSSDRHARRTRETIFGLNHTRCSGYTGLPLVMYREPDDPGTSSVMPLTNEATIDPMVTTPINALNVPAIPTMPSSLINTIHEPRRTHL